VKEDLFARMKEMNDAARLDFARSVRWAEVKWMGYFLRAHGDTSGDETSIVLQECVLQECVLQEQEEIHSVRAG